LLVQAVARAGDTGTLYDVEISRQRDTHVAPGLHA